jgi:hypothetical protein
MQRCNLRWTAAVAFLFLMAGTIQAANHRTANFIIDAPSAAFAKEVGDAAEIYRKRMAIEWTGKTMPNWSRPCLISVHVGPQLGAGGATTFMFDRGEVFGWRMTIQGSRERILDSVLPHEVTHTVIASHFRQPLPRWADEGGCTTVEHTSERAKQERMLVQFLQTGRGISFARMFAMKEYPHDVMPLYAQGYSLARYLIGHGGKRKFISYIGDGLDSENWDAATKKHYGHASLGVLQNAWLQWVRRGMPIKPGPDAKAPSTTLVNNKRRARPKPNLIYRPKPSASGSVSRAKMVPIDRTAKSKSNAHAARLKSDATVAASKGWYAAGRREPVGYGRDAESVARSRERKAGDQPVTRHVVRPQPAQPVRQVILEWSGTDGATRKR